MKIKEGGMKVSFVRTERLNQNINRTMDVFNAHFLESGIIFVLGSQK